MPHIHASAVDFLTLAAYVIIFGALWRTLAAKWAHKPIGGAMAFIY